jgi:butyrate kinase
MMDSFTRLYPGDDEMEAFAMHGYMVLQGEIEVKEY